MSLYTRLRDYFLSQPSAPKLRNRPGGLAFIKPHGHGTGSEEIFGQVVTTVQAQGQYWSVEPNPVYTTLVSQVDVRGTVAHRGTRMSVVAIRDDVLQPIPDAGITREEVAKLYAPQKKEEQKS